MSSDVYIYHHKKLFELEKQWHTPENDGLINNQRVGHLGIMCYFGIHAINLMIELENKITIINDEWASEMIVICEWLDKALLDAIALDDEAFSRKFGYHKPSPEEFEDRITAKTVDYLLQNHRGEEWRVSWD
jgi:hypothetical protein